MKKLILFLFLLIGIVSHGTFGQILSNGTGGGIWSDPSTWDGGVPTVDDDVTILAGDSVYAGVGAQCNNLTVSSDGIFATSSEPVEVNGFLTLEANSWFYNQVNEENLLPGTGYNIDPASTVVHSAGGSVGGDNNLEFGNLIIQKTSGTTAGGNLIIYGDLTINNAAQNMYFRGTDVAHGNQTHTVHGDVHVRRGTWTCIDVGEPGITCVWNVEGNVYVYGSGPQEPGTGVTEYDARMGPFSSASATGTGIFNINGDLIVNGGRLQAGTSSTAGTGTGIINLEGNLTVSANSAVSTNHLGPFALNFVGNGTQTVSLEQRFSMTTNVFDTVKVGSNTVFVTDSLWRSTTGGDFVVEGSLELAGNANISGAGNFTLNPGSTLKIGSAAGISNTEASGNILVTGTRTFSSEANYEYKGAEAQVPGDGLPAAINGLAVNNLVGLTIPGNYTVNSSLNIINGFLDLNDNTITLGETATLIETPGNTVSGAGSLTTTQNIGVPSALNVGGLGAEITSSNDLGTTTVERTHTAAAGNNNQGIVRQFNISPGQNNSGLNATLRLYYDETELNGLVEDDLRLYMSPDGTDDSWTHLGGTPNVSENYVELSGVDELSYWTLASINQTLPVEDEDNTIPNAFTLLQNYPNPFNPETLIKFEIPKSSLVNITVYNLLGQKVATIINEVIDAGIYQINFNAKNLSTGIYIYKLTSENFSSSKKMIYLK